LHLAPSRFAGEEHIKSAAVGEAPKRYLPEINRRCAAAAGN